MEVAIIGGGAAGFFSGIHVKINYPDANVTIFEKSKKVLSKVKISGGGRCNVTNNCPDIDLLAKAYPRGSKKLRQAFYSFNTQHTMEWFESRGVKLVTQEDHCVFPRSQDSQSIIDCFMNEVNKLGVGVQTQANITEIHPEADQLSLKINDAYKPFDKVIVTTGGSPKEKGLEWLKNCRHEIETPVPSLFTFNMPNESIRELMGVVVEKALVKIQGEKLLGDGPLLITHWGMSGPAILKLSAFGARILANKNYSFKIHVNWVNELNQDVVRAYVNDLILTNPKKQLNNVRPYLIPKRLWDYLLNKADLAIDKQWNALNKKEINRIVQLLAEDSYEVSGKTTFKEEFVTCGGISLSSINFKTMQSKEVPNLYFAGEVLDIDGITGGFNFQAAWTTAFIAAKLK